MKKIILLLILILPVAIVFLSFSIAGFVGRAIMYAEISDVIVSDEKWDDFMSAGYFQKDTFGKRFEISTVVGGTYELEKFFTVVPSRAKFSSLEFVYSNEFAVKVESGKIHVLENMRTSDRSNGGVEINATHGEKTFFTINVKIAPDKTRFDYLGFDYNALSNSLTSPHCSVSNGYLLIEKGSTPTLTISDFSRLLRNGLDVAPCNLLDNTNADRLAFANTIELSSSNPSVLALLKQGTDSDGINIFLAQILSKGEAEVAISATWGGKTLQTLVKVLVE